LVWVRYRCGHQMGDSALAGSGASLTSTCPRAHCCLISSFPVRVLLLAVSFFLLFSRAIPYKLDIRVSVYIRPVCINALSLRESPSRLGLHNNALDLRESSSRLGLHNNALGLRESLSRLGLHTMPLAYQLFLSSVWLPSGLLNPGPGRLPAASYK
jgi:hypothetical protein